MASNSSWVQSALATYESRLLRYAQRILGDESLAQDAVQETFLRLCREAPEHLNGHLTQWLYKVCRSQAMDVLRKESRMTALMQMHAVERPLETQQTLPEDYGRLLAAVGALPAREQECVRLKFEHGLSYREIATVTGMSVSHVGVALHHALKKLRANLNGHAADAL